MQVAVFSTRPHDRRFLEQANAAHGFTFQFYEARLRPNTVKLAEGADVVSAFVHDDLSAAVLEQLATFGVPFVALRCAGFNNVDIDAAAVHGITVARVPAYSPHAVAEHTIGLILTLSRKFHRAYQRVREGNFLLQGLLGFELHTRTVGIVGTGRIGATVARLLVGFGCRVVATDVEPAPECEAMGVEYFSLPALLEQADIVTLHCPLMPATHHMIDASAFARMKAGAMLINTSRGGLMDAAAAVDALKSGRLGYLGLDVYEEEADLFYSDLSDRVIQDDVFARLLTFPNVLITGHQAFFTEEALTAIAETTLRNIAGFAANAVPAANLVTGALRH